MALIQIARKSRMTSIPEDTDICTLLFRNRKAMKACRLFLEWLKEGDLPYSGATRHQVSQFGRDLEAGLIERGFKYSRKSFYVTILRRLVNLGFIGLRDRWANPGRPVEKYVPIYQPIPKNSPSRKNFWNIAWQICRKWNEEWSPGMPKLSKV